MNSAEQDALEIAKVAAMIGGQLKQVDSFTSQTVNSSKGPTNRINAEQVYHQQKQMRTNQAQAAAPAPPPAPSVQPVVHAHPPPVSNVAPVAVPSVPVEPVEPVNAAADRKLIDDMIAREDKICAKLASLTTAINKLQKTIAKQ